MAFVVLTVALFTASLGVLAIASPDRFAVVLGRFQTPAGLYFAAAIRLLFGVALFLSAPDSRAPDTLRTLGMIFVVAGLSMPFVGLELFRRIVEGFLALGPGIIRAWGALALAFGLLLVYAVVP